MQALMFEMGWIFGVLTILAGVELAVERYYA